MNITIDRDYAQGVNQQAAALRRMAAEQQIVDWGGRHNVRIVHPRQSILARAIASVGAAVRYVIAGR